MISSNRQRLSRLSMRTSKWTKGIKSIVLAAGEGRSLFPLTKDRPKVLLPVRGTSLLERLSLQLHRLGVQQLVVVVGYKQEKVISALKKIRRLTGMQIEVVANDRYSTTNTLYSLHLAAARCLAGPLLVIDGDVVCEDKVLARVVRCKQDAVLAVDTHRTMGDEEVKVRCNGNSRVVAIGKDLRNGSAEFLGISKFSAQMASTLVQTAGEILSQRGGEEYYEAAFNALIHHGGNVHALDIAGLKWMEIDFPTDYAEALRLFGTRRELRDFHASRRARRQYLFCPGPVIVSPKVKEALANAEVGHREVEFSEVLNRVRMKLGQVYGVKNFHRYATVVITGSGSAANEAVLGSAANGKKLLILSNGEFGERWIEMAEHLNLSFESLKVRWGQPIPLRATEELIRRSGIDAVCMVHHETSTGMLNPLDEVSSLAKRYHKELFVDAISSIGAVPLDVEANEITFCTGSANKAIASVPGLSFVCGKRSAFEALKTERPHSLYLDLHRHFVYNDEHYQTPNTPAVNLFFALESALDQILDQGLSRTFEKYRDLADQLREGLKKLGFRFFIPEKYMSPVLSSVELPIGFGADEFHDRLKELGYITYPGKGILRERLFQVANIGEITSSQVRSFLRTLASVECGRSTNASGNLGGRTRRTASSPDRLFAQATATRGRETDLVANA